MAPSTPATVQYLAPQLYTSSVASLRRFYVDVVGFVIQSGSSSHAVLDIHSSADDSRPLRSHDEAVLRIRIDEASFDVQETIGRSTIVLHLQGVGVDDAAILNYRARIVANLERYAAEAGGAEKAEVSEWRRHGYGLGLFTVTDPNGNRIIVRQDRATYSG